MKDYYLILGVPRNATPRGIRKAFLQQAKACHPDRTGSDKTSPFRDVAEAYEVLSDPERRRRYDSGLRPPPVRPIPAEPPPPRTTAPPAAPRSRYGYGRPEPEPLVPESPRPESRHGPRPEPLAPEPPWRPVPFDLRPSPSRFRTVGPTLDDVFVRWLRTLMGR